MKKPSVTTDILALIAKRMLLATEAMGETRKGTREHTLAEWIITDSLEFVYGVEHGWL